MRLKVILPLFSNSKILTDSNIKIILCRNIAEFEERQAHTSFSSKHLSYQNYYDFSISLLKWPSPDQN